jgi:hypothetical protein
MEEVGATKNNIIILFKNETNFRSLKKSLLNETNFGMKNFKTETVPKNKQKSQENEDEQLEELHQIWR